MRVSRLFSKVQHGSIREPMSLGLANRPFFVNEPQKQQFGQLRAAKTLCLLRTVLFGKLLRTSILV
jgi:hypothetical protein